MDSTKQTNGHVERLVSEHLYLVQHIVHELAARFPRHVDRQELWSAGALGLVESARRYDAASEVPFGNYARRRIRGAILDSTRARDWAPRSVRRDQRELDAAAATFERTHDRSANDPELAEVLGVDEAEVARRRAAVLRGTVLHLDQPVGTDDGNVGSLADTLVSADDDTSPEAHLEQRELLGAVRTAVGFLTGRQRDVVERYYFRGELLRDIADSMGVTEARVSQLRGEAVRALQAYLDDADYLSPDVGAAAAPGKRQRAAFVAQVTENTTWRQRLEAADAGVDWESAVACG